MRRANNSGTVYKLSGPRRRPWLAKLDGKIIGYYATKEEGIAELNKKAGLPIPDLYNATFDTIYKYWYDEHAREMSDTTKKTYRIAYEATHILHKRVFRELRTYDFQNCLDNYPTQTNGTIGSIKSVINMMGEYAMAADIIEKNYAKYVKIPKDKKKEKETFSKSEIDKIKDCADSGNLVAASVMVLLYTGMRRAEFTNLQVANCKDNYLIGGEKTDAGKNRIIPIAPPGLPYYIQLRNDAIEKGRDTLSPWTEYTWYEKYRKLLKDLKISYKSPHSTRHTFCSLAAEAGVPATKLQKIVGHANYSTTAEIYTHPQIEDLIAAAGMIK